VEAVLATVRRPYPRQLRLRPGGLASQATGMLRCAAARVRSNGQGVMNKGNEGGKRLWKRPGCCWGPRKPAAVRCTHEAGKVAAKSRYEADLQVACEAVKLASKLCKQAQEQLRTKETLSKDDMSPVTVADLGSQAIISWALQNLPQSLSGGAPPVSLVAEEDSNFLRSEEGSTVRTRVVQLVNDTLASSDIPSLSETEVLDAIDRGNADGGSKGRHWVLDPIDGTRGFVADRQYAIALALLDEGQPVVGVLGCPNLGLDAEGFDIRRSTAASGGSTSGSDEGSSSQGFLFFAEKDLGAFASAMAAEESKRSPSERICVDDVDPAEAVYMESVESKHSDHEFAQQVAALAGVTKPPTRIDSQAKYGVIAAGKASAFMRFPEASYKENIWDHAAGAVIMSEAGGVVSDSKGNPLDFSKGRILNNANGIVAAPPVLHKRIIDAIRTLQDNQ